jgi:hypothetical protein
MEDKDWKTLIHTIRRGDCILMLGPEIWTEEIDGKPVTLLELFAREIFDDLPDKTAIVDPKNLAYIAQRYSNLHSPVDLQVLAESFYRQKISECSGIHYNLANLPFYLVINATPDHYFANALKKREKEYFLDWYNFRQPRKDMVKEATVEKPLIYYLYGSINDPSSLVISENDLLDFLVAVISKNPSLPVNIASKLQDPNKCFLFLGFGFKNWYLRILLYVLKGGHRASRSFALEHFETKPDERFQSAIIYYKDEFKLYLFNEDIGEFVSELASRYADDTKKIPNLDLTKQFEVIKPKVFISYASEDSDKAAELSEELRVNGFEFWLDKEDIRGGDRWNQLIEKTIREVDYFVALQSKALERKTIGYVNKEILLALERQKEFRVGIRFIIPLKIDDCELLEELDYLQTIDLSKPDGFNKLTRTIRRDYQRRHRE